MEQFSSVCRNPWCKATFFYTENDFVFEKKETDKRLVKNKQEEPPAKVPPIHCKKCQSFDKELSGGVSWQEKKYEGSRNDNMPHQIRYKVTNYRL